MVTGFRGLRRADPLSVVTVTVALGVLALHGVSGRLAHDPAVYAYAGQQVADGVPPYEGILNRAGPLAHLLPGVGAVVGRWTGTDELVAMRSLYLVLAALAVGVAYLTGRSIYRSTAAGIAAAAVLVSFTAFCQPATSGPREKVPMVLFILLGLWAASTGRWVTAGVFVGLATLTLQTGFTSAFPAVLVAALAAPERGRALVRVVLGGAATATVTAVYLWLAGAWAPFLEGFVLLNLNGRYTHASGLLADLPAGWDALVHGYDGSLPFFLVGLASLPVLTVLAWRRAREDGLRLLGLTAGALGGLLFLLRDFDDIPDTLTVLPFSVLGIAGIAAELELRVNRSWTRWAVTGTVAVSLVLATANAVDRRDENGLAVQRASVQAMLDALPDGARIMSAGAPQAMVLAGQDSPTRRLTFPRSFIRQIRDTEDEGFSAFLDWFKAQGPELVAVDPRMQERWASRLSPEYQRVGRTLGWAWYARTSLGEGVLAELRRTSRRLALNRD